MLISIYYVISIVALIAMTLMMTIYSHKPGWAWAITYLLIQAILSCLILFCVVRLIEHNALWNPLILMAAGIILTISLLWIWDVLLEKNTTTPKEQNYDHP